MAVRVVLDTNIFISYLLLLPGRRSLASAVFESILNGDYTLLTCDLLLHELESRVARKPYLDGRIADSALALLVETLAAEGEDIVLPEGPYPEVVRDSKDDFLMTLATLGRADLLIIGDRDLLELDVPMPFRIMNMSDFLAEFEDD